MNKPSEKAIPSKYIKFYMVVLFASAILLNAGCGGGGGGGGSDTSGGVTPGGPGIVNLSMKVSNLSSDGISTEASITPGVYKIALVNFWLIKDDTTEINLINPDKDNPVYTEDNPLIADFFSGELTTELLTGATLAEGTYTGYKMQFLYIEMQFPVYLHLPSICVETDLATVYGLDISSFQPDEIPEAMNCNFRLYFNAHGKYWKRDFVLNIEDLNMDGYVDEWFWLRREVDDSYSNFFISVTQNTLHPSGSPGPDNTIDLFDDHDFWGGADDYDDSTNPIIITSGSTVGGLNATIEPFTISGGVYDVSVNVDVENTLNYSDNSTPPSSDYSFHPNILDLGPTYGVDNYGDTGLHPFLPAFSVASVKVTS
jgi:hypothetical protein